MALSRLKLVRHTAFVVRCSAAATLSYMLANAAGLPHSVWASVSALIVSQDTPTATNSATVGRLAGTILGITIAAGLGSLLQSFGAETPVLISVCVAVCAAIVRRFPLLRASMWTVLIIFFSESAETPLFSVALWRGAEVILGALTGVALHWVAEALLRRLGVGDDTAVTHAMPTTAPPARDHE